ncbi:MAG: hypothetical protein K9H84_06310 [Bacteroidales bacterium]|nr:hypothetical protein [Bacteroidales bacterium]
MKKIITVVIIFLFTILATGQNTEFKLNENGLLYSKQDLELLRSKADSLNQAFRELDHSPVYYSKYQAIGHYIDYSGDHVKAAKADLENNIGYDEFLANYPNTTVDDSLVIVKFRFKNYKDEEVIEYSSIRLGNDNEHSIKIEDNPDIYNKKVKNSWIIDYWEGSEYSAESVSAFYFPAEFKKQKLPEDYNRMVGYSEFMIDTSTHLFLVDERASRYQHDDTTTTDSVQLFLDFIHAKTSKPDHDDYEEYEEYREEWSKWDSLRFIFIDQELAGKEEFVNMLSDAYHYAINHHASSDELEEYVAQYLSKEKALSLKRHRNVVGQCSMDQSPRYHALNISRLAAETGHWNVFIRAHMNIMNDRFSRMSDGSYAWGSRQTYLKELEEINIRTPELFMGIALRIEDPASNHYYGNIGRLGRAMAESEYTSEFEDIMIQMIKDDQLDDFNRIITYYLFLNYNGHLNNKTLEAKNEDKLNKAIEHLPGYILNRIKSEYTELKRLLRKEIDLIEKHFDISEPMIGSKGSLDWDMTDDGECWSAKLKDKSEDKHIVFYVNMDNNIKPGSIKPLLKQKDKLLKRVHKASFLMSHMEEHPESELKIHFTRDKSFSDKAQESFLEEVPEDLKNQYQEMLDNTILMTLSNEHGWSRWLIFRNNDIMLWHYSKKPPLGKYTPEELITPGGLFNSSFKLFDENGKIFN